jgi:peptide deformylase
MSTFEIIPNEQTPRIPEMETHISHFIEYNKETLTSFLNFARNYPNTIGLAANQVSLNGERWMARFFAYYNENVSHWELVIDPKITKYLGWKEKKNEGCKTWYGKHMVAERYKAVQVSYFDMNDEFHENEIFTNYTAQIWQHETDHLNGVFQNITDTPETLPSELNPQRNDICPCNSGLKYKKCCIKYSE